MKNIGCIAFSVFLCLLTFVSAQDSKHKGDSKGRNDPRTGLLPVILFPNGENRRAAMEEPLLVYARWDIKPPNQILGVEGSFTDEQIISGLKEFYSIWKAPEDDSSRPKPQLILAAQNWGSGSSLYDRIEAISIEFKVDVYLLYPVLGDIAFVKNSPAPNDKTLAAIIEKQNKAEMATPRKPSD